MVKCVSQTYLTLNRKIDLSFIFEQCIVQTVQSIPTVQSKESFEFGHLQLSIEFELKEYESLADAPIFTRPRYLSLLGIISFLVSEPFTVFATTQLSTVEVNILDELKVGQQSSAIASPVGWVDARKPNINQLITVRSSIL